jgi:hypothetical protein
VGINPSCFDKPYRTRPQPSPPGPSDGLQKLWLCNPTRKAASSEGICTDHIGDMMGIEWDVCVYIIYIHNNMGYILGFVSTCDIPK